MDMTPRQLFNELFHMSIRMDTLLDKSDNNLTIEEKRIISILDSRIEVASIRLKLEECQPSTLFLSLIDAWLDGFV